jgi:hypothetical protein
MSLKQLRSWARTIIHGRGSRRRPGRPRLERLEERLTPDAVSWTGGGDGVSWGDARNWSTATRLPGAADDVTIDAPGTVVLHASGTDSVRSLQSDSTLLLSGGSLALAADSAISGTVVLNGGSLSAAGPLALGGLEQTAGTLSGAGTVTIQGQWDWGGGTQSGTGHTAVLGNTDLSGSGATAPQLSGRAVDSDGTATLHSGSTLTFAGGAAWNNQSDGAFVLQGGATLSGPVLFNNAGLFQLTGTQGASIGTFNNAPGGLVDVQGGVLSLGGGSGSGTFDLEGSSVLFISGTYNLQDGAASVGRGIVSVGGALNVTGGVSLRNLSTGGTVTVNAGAGLDVQNLGLGGTLTGPGDVTVENDFTWFSGTLGGSGDTTLNGTAELNGVPFATQQLSGRTVDNHGTVTLFPNIALQFNSGTWNNDIDGTLILQQGSTVGGTSAAVLNNDGLVQMFGQGHDSVGVTLNNSATGTVDAEGSPLGGGTLTLAAGSSAGTFRVATTATLDFTHSSAGFAFLDGATAVGEGRLQLFDFSGPLAVTVSGHVSLQTVFLGFGTLTVNAGGSLDVQSLRLSGGTLTGPGDLTVGGDLVWTGGTLGGTGQTFLEGTAQVGGIGGFVTLDGRTVNNDGTATFLPPASLAVQGDGVWNNDAGASLTLPGGSSVNALGFGPHAALNNAGLLQTAGSGTVTVAVPLTNADTGTIQVRSGTTLSSPSFSPGAFQTSGTVTIATGAAFVMASYTQTGGTTTVDGTLTANPGGVFLNGGFLGGSGTINGNVTNAAELAPGGSPGTLTINGNYTQTSAGVLDIEIGGRLPDQYDRLVINGTASLAGTLNVVLLNGYVPGAGTSFGVLTFRSHSGDFDAENGLDLGGGLSLAPVYAGNDTGLSLVATQS